MAGGTVKPLKLSGLKGAVAVEKPVTLGGESLTLVRLFVAIGSGRNCELYMGIVLPSYLEGDAFYNDHLAPLLDTLELTAPKTKTSAPPEARENRAKKAQTERKQKEAEKQREEQKQKEREQSAHDMEAAVQKAIDETKQAILDQEASMQQILQARAAEAEHLKSLGFFKFSQKAAAREKIAQLDKEFADEQQKLQSMKAARLAKVQEVLKQYPQPEPTKLPFQSAGASQATLEKAGMIASVLYSFDPMTPDEINRALGTDYTALQIANAAKYVPNIATVRVYRVVADRNGDPVLRQYTAYCRI